jgi:YVTN family beta-propeller protein
MWVKRVSYIVLVSLLVLELAPVISYALSSPTQSVITTTFNVRNPNYPVVLVVGGEGNIKLDISGSGNTYTAFVNPGVYYLYLQGGIYQITAYNATLLRVIPLPRDQGVVDYGIGKNFQPYVLKFYTVYGSISYYNLKAEEYPTNLGSWEPVIALQQNVVLQVLTTGGVQEYWVQNVLHIDTQNYTGNMEVNVWNFTTYNAVMNSNELYFTKGKVSLDVYIYLQPSFSFYVSNGTTVVTTVNNSQSGATIMFGIMNSSGTFYYDNLTIKVPGFITSYFLVDGENKTGNGLYYDAELNLGGIFGHSAVFTSGTAVLSVKYRLVNGTIISPPNFFPYSLDTGERALGIEVSPVNGQALMEPGSISESIKNFGAQELQLSPSTTTTSDQPTPIQYEEYTLFLFNNTLVSGNGVVYDPNIWPVGILYDPYNGLVYVAECGNQITVINPTTMSVVDTIDVSGGPIRMALDPTNHLIYVTLSSSNQVAVLNPSTNAIVDYIPVGSSPIGIIYAEGLIYVANSGETTISVINPNTDQVINTISTSGIPIRLAFDPVNGMIYATTSNGVAVINPKTDSQVTTISLPFSLGVAVDPSTGYVYVAVASSDYVAVINPSTNTVVNEIVTGSSPTNIKIGGNLMFVVNRGSDTLTIVNLTDDDVVANIPVGNYPQGDCIVGNSIYVANSKSSSISIIRLNIQIPNVPVTTPITTNNTSTPTPNTTQTNSAPMHKIGSLLRAFEKHLFLILLIVALILVILVVVIIIIAAKH